MPTTPTASPSGRLAHRLRRTVILALAAVAAVSAPQSAAAAGGEAPDPRPRQPLVAVGEGKVTDPLPFCFNGAPQPCGWIIQGTHSGTPIHSGTFYAAIDNGGIASSRHCVPAIYSGILYDAQANELAHTADGRVCPNGAGGHVFTGRSDDISGNGLSGDGRFGDVSGGRAHIRVTVSPNGSARLFIAGHLRTG